MFYHLFLLLSLVSTGCANVPWQAVDQLLRDAVEERVFPGAVALVADEGGVLYKTAVGSLTYGQKTPMGQPNSALSASSSIFDMASCTKVIATTSAISLLFQGNYFGEKGLQTKVGSVLGTEYNINGKSEITIENCLLHNAGFPPGKYLNHPAGGLQGFQVSISKLLTHVETNRSDTEFLGPKIWLCWRAFASTAKF